MTQYIGITGITRRSQIRELQKLFDADPAAPKLMVGILASNKTVGRRRNKYPRSFPLVQRIPGLMEAIDPTRAFGLIHYSSFSYESYEERLASMHQFSGDCRTLITDMPRDVTGFSGFQFNMALPQNAELQLLERMFRAMSLGTWRSVLQYWPARIGELEAIVRQARRYAGPPLTLSSLGNKYGPNFPFKTVLLDVSGGYGQELDVASMLALLQSGLDDSYLASRVSFAVAGGLSAQTVKRLRPLVDSYPQLSIDAQGRLRDSDGWLDMDAAKRYIEAAQKLLSRD